MFDESDIPVEAPAVAGSQWITTFCDLIALMLTFFVMLYSVSARDPSRVDATVSSVTDKFAKSRVISEFGTVASQAGVVMFDQEYLDSVISTIRGRDANGQVKQISVTNGTLMVRFVRDNIFVSNTGVLTQQGAAMARDIASAMRRRDVGVVLPVIELRLTVPAEEISAGAAPDDTQSPLAIRQVSRFAKKLVEEQVPAEAISTLVLEGDKPAFDMAFYLLSDIENSESAAPGWN
ncbi:MAG: flagellar motor protein MotB [Pseudomonadota bacterium]